MTAVHTAARFTLALLGAVLLLALGQPVLADGADPCPDCFLVYDGYTEWESPEAPAMFILSEARHSADPENCPCSTPLAAHSHDWARVKQMTMTVLSDHECGTVLPYDEIVIETMQLPDTVIACATCITCTVTGRRMFGSDDHYECTSNPGWSCQRVGGEDVLLGVYMVIDSCSPA